MREGTSYPFVVFPAVVDDLGPELTYVQEYVACLQAQTNEAGFPTATAVLGRGGGPYQAIADLCAQLAEDES